VISEGFAWMASRRICAEHALVHADLGRISRASLSRLTETSVMLSSSRESLRFTMLATRRESSSGLRHTPHGGFFGRPR
jgi:hypothetical protein